jgi:hypothetical protein
MQTLEDILARHPFLNDLPPQYLPLLIECASIEEFGPGEQIFKKGYDAEHFYLIQHGKVALETAYVSGEALLRFAHSMLAMRSGGPGFFLLTSANSVRARSSRPKPSSSRQRHCVTRQKRRPPSDTILPYGWVA